MESELVYYDVVQHVSQYSADTLLEENELFKKK